MISASLLPLHTSSSSSHIERSFLGLISSTSLSLLLSFSFVVLPPLKVLPRTEINCDVSEAGGGGSLVPVLRQRRSNIVWGPGGLGGHSLLSSQYQVLLD